MNRRAKIVCTLGPATSSLESIRALVAAGMDVARLNFSHATHEQHAAVYHHVRTASDEAGRAVGILADLQGPKLRLGRFVGGEALLETGAEFVLTTDPVDGTAARASTTYKALASDLAAGDAVLLDDGRLRLQVTAIEGSDVRTRVVEGGRISDHKGINLPGANVSAGALTDKDVVDLRFALSLRVDFIALSFVRSAADAEAVRAIMRETNDHVPVIAKLEKPQAVVALDAICEAFDGLMVARGDLGVELPLERVPHVQKRVVQRAREFGKPVIVATQMLESMVSHSRPSRAEASDVANAVLDGADALMLSAETSIGAYPVQTVETMARIISTAEDEAGETEPAVIVTPDNPNVAIAASAPRVAHDIHAAALVAFTLSGSTASLLARHRPAMQILVFTTETPIRSQLALSWGIETFVVPFVETTDEMVKQVDHAMIELGRAHKGDRVVIVAGSPPGKRGTTNMIRVHKLGSL